MHLLKNPETILFGTGFGQFEHQYIQNVDQVLALIAVHRGAGHQMRAEQVKGVVAAAQFDVEVPVALDGGNYDVVIALRHEDVDAACPRNDR